MDIVNTVQGSSEWLAHRARCWNAGDAPAMLGCSPYETRQHLLHRLATGIAPEVDAATQRRFDEGHRFEALARPLAEEMIGDDLAPVVGTTDSPLFMEGGRPLGASFDGITFMGDIVFEHKTLNQDLRNSPRFEIDGTLDPTALPKHYRVQMEQQMIVSGAERVLFMATRWENDACVERLHCFYLGDHALSEEILAGWRQFASDLAAYDPAAQTPAPTPAVGIRPEAVPALVLDVEGRVIDSNLDAWKSAAIARIEAVNTNLVTDEDFANAKEAAKWCKDSVDLLKATKAAAIARMTTVEAVFSAVDQVIKTFDAKRISINNLVDQRNEVRKGEIVAVGIAGLRKHIEGLNTRLGAPLMPASATAVDFGSVIKGMRSFANMEDAVSTKLAAAKIAANEIADRIDANLKALDAVAPEHAALFPDRSAIVLKAPEDCATLIRARVAEHDAAVKRRAEEAAERERERIRREEAARVEREAQERAAAERRQAEAAAAAERAAQAAAVPPTPAPTYPPAPPAQALTTGPANVVPMPTKAPAATPPSLKLGAISERLGFTVTADFLARVGFQPAATDKAAKLYHEADFGRICDSIVAHIRTVQHQQQAA